MKSGVVFQVHESDIDVIEWMHVARGYELKVLSLDGSVTKFVGFKENVSVGVLRLTLKSTLLSV